MIYFDFSVGSAVEVRDVQPYIEPGRSIFDIRIRTRFFEFPYVTFNGRAEQPLVATRRPRNNGEIGMEDYQFFEPGEIVINTWPDHRHFVYRLSLVRTETEIRIKDEDPSLHGVVPWTFNELFDSERDITQGLVFSLVSSVDREIPTAWDRLNDWVPGDAF